MASQNPKSKTPPKSSRMTWVLVGVTACVVSVTIYLGLHKMGKRPEVPDTTPQVSDADKVLAQIARNLRDARRLSPRLVRERQVAYQISRDLMETYVHTHPDDAQVRPHLADLLLTKMGDPEAALKVAEALLALRPKSAEGLWLKGQCMKAQGQAGYEQFLEQAAQSPDAREAIWSRYGLELLQERKPADAEAYLNKAYQAGAKDAATLSTLARFALRQKRFEDAERLLAQAVRDEAAEPATWWMLAMVQKDNGKFEEAETAVREAIRLLPTVEGPAYEGPNKGDMLLTLGQVLLLRKRTAEAADAFVESANHPFSRPMATFQAAQCRYLLGSYSQALGLIDEAERLLPGDPAVAEWKKKIEDAHLPRPATAPAGISVP